MSPEPQSEKKAPWTQEALASGAPPSVEGVWDVPLHPRRRAPEAKTAKTVRTKHLAV